MNKMDLVKELSERLGMSQKECCRFLECFNQIALEGLQQNKSIKITGLGRLYPCFQAARPGRNPRTGVDCIIRERVSVRFKVSKYLIDMLNANKKQEENI